MIRNKRNLLWLIPLLLFVTSPLWKPSVAAFLAPRGGYSKEMAILSSKAEKNFLMDTVTIYLSTAGKKEWQITAAKAYTGKTDREIEMVDVRALYIGEEREPTEIKSRSGRYFVDNRHLMLINKVEIRRPRTNEQMFTDLLHYYDATKMAVSPGNVDLKGPNFILNAGRMDYDLSTDGYDFSDRVKVDL